MTTLRPLIEQLKNLLTQIATDEGLSAQSDDLVHQLDDITNTILLAGNRASSILADVKSSKEGKGLAFEINTHINSTIKQILILMRNALIENNKAMLYLAEGKISESTLTSHLQATRSTIQKALNECTETMDKVLTKTNSTHLEKAYEKSRLVEDPHPTYALQVKDIQEQSHSIKAQQAELLKVQEVIAPLSQQLNAKMDALSDHIKQLGVHMDHFLEVLSAAKDFSQSDVNTKLDQFIQFSHQEISNDELLSGVRQQLQDLPRDNYIVGTRNAQVTTRDIDFKLTINRWLDVNLMPFLIEVLESYQELQSRVSIALHNTKNKIALTKPENIEDGKRDILPVLSHLRQDIETQFMAISQSIVTNKKLIYDEMRISRLFEDKEFLYFGLQGSVNQALKAQNDKFNELSKTVKERFGSFMAITKEWKQPQSNSLKEQIAECLNTRINKKSTEIYDQVFQNNPFLSEVFLVPRHKKELRAQEAIEYWQSGNHSSILIVGNQLSGKTTLAKKIANNFSVKHSFRINANETLSCYGNRVKIGINLKEALDHINAYANNQTPLVVIDDLEKWQGQGFSILDNIEALTSFLSRRGNKVMVIATIGPVLMEKLKHYYHLPDYFFSVIDVTRCEYEEAEKTINVRHAATHKVLMNEREEALSVAQRNKIIKTIYNQANGNIGDILQRWTFGSQGVSANQVVFKHRYSELPSLVTHKNEALIETLFLFGKLREQDLIDIFGRTIFDGYREGLKQLLNDHIVIRDIDQYLKINPSIANDLLAEYIAQRQVDTTVQ